MNDHLEAAKRLLGAEDRWQETQRKLTSAGGGGWKRERDAEHADEAARDVRNARLKDFADALPAEMKNALNQRVAAKQAKGVHPESALYLEAMLLARGLIGEGIE